MKYRILINITYLCGVCLGKFILSRYTLRRIYLSFLLTENKSTWVGRFHNIRKKQSLKSRNHQFYIRENTKGHKDDLWHNYTNASLDHVNKQNKARYQSHPLPKKMEKWKESRKRRERSEKVERNQPYTNEPIDIAPFDKLKKGERGRILAIVLLAI